MRPILSADHKAVASKISNRPIKKNHFFRSLQAYSDAVISPSNKLTIGQVCALRFSAAWLLASVYVATTKNNPLLLAHDMAEVTKSAPWWLPCNIARLDSERIMIDAIHWQKIWGNN